MAFFCLNTPSWAALKRGLPPMGSIVAMILMIGACSVVQEVKAQSTVQITALTPQEAYNMPDSSTIVLELATSLLGGTPAMLWGIIASDAVITICNQVVYQGGYGFSASIAFDGDTFTREMQIIAFGGCDASLDLTDGVEAVLQDDEGDLSALICPQGSDTSGCLIFDTSDDITSLYYGPPPNGVSEAGGGGGGGGRKLLDNCFSVGTQEGAKFGFIGGILVGIFFL